MYLQTEMKFVKYEDGEALFINSSGEEVWYGYPNALDCSWSKEITGAIHSMELGKIYDFQAVEGMMIDVIGENKKYERLKSEDERVRYLKRKMSDGDISEAEFAEAIRLGVKIPYKSHSWVLVVLGGVFAMYTLGGSNGALALGGLALFKIMMENLKK